MLGLYRSLPLCAAALKGDCPSGLLMRGKGVRFCCHFGRLTGSTTLPQRRLFCAPAGIIAGDRLLDLNRTSPPPYDAHFSCAGRERPAGEATASRLLLVSVTDEQMPTGLAVPRLESHGDSDRLG